ncbi:MAG TPA: SDR family oxidoreductase [Candidatus Limnocylindrales bacterium]|nr:SDR family oxidoreductase [Candidatus Limnocylindrales bacterium]
MRPIDDRVVLITGAGSGLGAATARTLAAAGMTVIAADIDDAAAAGTVAQLEGAGGTGLAVRLDVRDAASAEAAIGGVVDRFGRLDVLINNAGTDMTAAFDEIPADTWDRVLDVNLRGPAVMTRAALPHLRESGVGHIVNITSTAAKRAWPNASAYHASKWGLLGFSHALHAEAREYGVKVTAIVCGGMRTPFLLERFPDLDPGVLQDPANVAETIRFVLSLPPESVIPEVTVLPMRETSWP